MLNQLQPVLRPTSIAIVGASNDPRKRGYQAIQGLLRDRFAGQIYPVNTKEKEILGLTAYDGITKIKEEVDLALIATPAQSVPAVLRDCGRKKVKGAIVLAVGFGETGVAGEKLQQEIIGIGQRENIRIVGPNTSGVFNLHHNMNLTGIRDLPKGSMAILSQSGNMTLSLITEIRAKSTLGFSAYVGVGNEADIQFHEYLEYFRQDPNTRIIVMFVDGMRDGRTFLQVAKETVEEKPIVLLKSGRSDKGRRAAQSHTGALAGLSAVSRTAFKRVGIITIDHSDELFPAAEALAYEPPLRRNRVAILSDGGGHGALAADALSDYAMSLPDLSEQTRTRLRAVLPSSTAVHNPLDLAGATDSNPGVFADCARVLLEDSEIDALMVVGLFGGYHIRFSDSLLPIEEDTARRLGQLHEQYHKPMVVHSLYASYRPTPLDILKGYRIPVHESIDIAAKCLSVLDEYGHHLTISHDRSDFIMKSEGKALPEVMELFASATSQRRKALLETEARQALRPHGVPITDYEFAVTGDDAVAAARRIGYPVVLKIISPDIVHKSDMGGVLLNLKNDDMVRDGFDLLVARARRQHQRTKVRGVIVTPMMPEGVEIVVGVTQDPQFGHVIMFGLGGIMVEVLGDVAFRVLPVGKLSAPQMLEEIRAHAILDGIRGRQPCDKGAIVDLLLRISDFVEAYSTHLAELDLNPVIVYEKGLTVVDARIILK